MQFNTQADFSRENDKKAMLTNGACVNEELLTFADNGYQGLFGTTKIAVRADNGSLTGVLGIVHDIAEQKVTENSLRVAATASESQEGMVVTDANSIILRVNHAFGVLVFNGDEGSQEDMTKWADAAMYEAKESGRNQIRFYGASQYV